MIKKGIIISSENEKLAIVEENIEFVLLRAGFTDYNTSKAKTKDKKFDENYKWAKDNNLKIGTFYESRATNIKEAKGELNFFCKIINNKEFEYPISIKLEDDHNTKIYYPQSQQTIKRKDFYKILKYMYNQLQLKMYIPLIITYDSWYTKLKKHNFNFLLDKKLDQKDIIYLDIHNLSKERMLTNKENNNNLLNKICIIIKKGYQMLKNRVRKK